MARGIGCSESNLSHQFKKYFKMSLGHYVAQMRLSKAVSLLRKNSLNISGVAQACGYGSLYAFGRKFRFTPHAGVLPATTASSLIKKTWSGNHRSDR